MSRTLLATSSLGGRVAQGLPDDDKRAATWVQFISESLLLATEAPGHEGETWTYVVRQPWERVCCGAHVDHPHAPDCDERLRCPLCHEPVFYRRGITGGMRSSGTSGYVHEATGEFACAPSVPQEVSA